MIDLFPEYNAIIKHTRGVLLELKSECVCNVLQLANILRRRDRKPDHSYGPLEICFRLYENCKEMSELLGFLIMLST